MRNGLEWREYLSDKYFNGIETDPTVWAERFPQKRDKLVVHIPARSGSKRLKNKNVASLCGVPLLAYTLLVAQKLPVDRIILSTDSAEYAKIGERYGAEVPYLRPPELSGDMVPAGVPQIYLLLFLMAQGYPVSGIIELYPTSPFRNVASMTSYCEIVRDTGHCCSVISPNCPQISLFGEGGAIGKGLETLKEGARFIKPVGLFTGQKVNSYEVFFRCFKQISNPVELIDIDDNDDFLLAQTIVENNLYDFGVEIC